MLETIVLYSLLSLLVQAQDYDINPITEASQPNAGCVGLVPESPVYNDPSNYQFASSFIQIFTSHVIPCDGYITSWQFVTRNSTIYQGLHFAVFRKSKLDNKTLKCLPENTYLQRINLKTQTTSRGVGKYVIMGVAQNPNAGAFPAWVELFVEKPIAVQKGDYVAVFYDAMETVDTLLTIPHYRGPKFLVSKKGATAAETLIFMKDQDDLEEYGNALNIYEAATDIRDIALVAMVSPTPVAASTTSPKTTTTTTTTQSTVTTASTSTTSVKVTSTEPKDEEPLTRADQATTTLSSLTRRTRPPRPTTPTRRTTTTTTPRRRGGNDYY